MTDFVTVLQCDPGRRLCKKYNDPGQAPEDYDAGMFFTPSTIQVATLEDLAMLLLEMSSEPEFCIIRGACHPDAEGQRVRRLAKDRDDCDAAFSPAAHYWIALDVDNSDETFLIDEPTECVWRWRRRCLPAGMWADDMIWQWSAKAHLSPTVRGRAWFWGNRPTTDDEARAFCKGYGFDPALNNPVQPHYTARPIFPAGVPDPILDPVIFLTGAELGARRAAEE